MSSAQARIEQLIVIKGQDSASAAVAKAKESLGQLGTQAGKTAKDVGRVGDSASDATKHIRETSGDVESALKGVSDFAGGASESVSKVGDAFGATEAIMRLLPGPLGLAATAVAGIGLASKLLFDMWSQNSAKLSILTDPSTRSLGEALGFSADETVKLQSALDNLTTKARPPVEALRQVVENAKAIGGDPAAAAAKYVGEWEKGPEAVRAMRSEIGLISSSLQTIPQLAKGLGLDPTALGLEASKSATDDLKAALTDLQSLEAGKAAQEAKYQDLRRRGADWQNADSVEEMKHYQRLAELERQGIQTTNERLELYRETVREKAAEVLATKDVQTLIQKTAADQQESDVLAQLAGSKKIANGIKLEGLEERRATLLAEQKRLMGLQNSDSSEAIQNALALLGLELKRTAVQEKTIKDQEAAEKRAKAQASAQKAKAARDKAAADEKRLWEARLRLSDEAAKKEAESFDAMVDREQAASDARKAVAVSASDAVRDARLAELDGLGQIQSALGRHDEAAATAARADAIRRDAEIAKIEESIAARRKEAQDRSTELIRDNGLGDDPLALAKEEARARDELAQLERERLAKLDQVQAQYALRDQQRKIEADRRAREELARRGQEINQLAQSASQGLGQFGGSAGKVGSALGSIGQGVEGVTSNWDDLSKAAPSVIGAVGGVAAAFVDGERSKAAILAAMEAATAVAAGASGNIPGAIGHGLAAGMYGAVAGGAFGGSSGSGSAGTAPALGSGTSTGSGSTGQSQGGPVQTVYNFNGLFVTKTQVGKAIADSQRSLRRTGLQTAKGGV